ncbi:MAG: T9SS type A sorting domain-containing protein [Flavobacteriales bacterium]|nr:T9SS type A sorting domain-containing protein [Flavobacteriales bacterium]
MTSTKVIIEGFLEAEEVVFNTVDSILVTGNINCERIFFNNGSLRNTGMITASEFCGLSWFPFPFNHAHVNDGEFICGGLSAYAVLVNTGNLMSGYGNFTVFSTTGFATFDGRLFVQSLLGVGEEGSLFVSDTLQIVQHFEDYGFVQCGHFVNGWSMGTAQSQVFAGGLLQCHDFINQTNGFVNGPGTICISGHSENHGVLNGPINICDISLDVVVAPYLDVNDGGFTLPVYHCANDPCATVGIAETEHTSGPLLYPSPTSGSFTIAMAGFVNARMVQVIDAVGRTRRLIQGPFPDQLVVDRGDLGSGVYLIAIHVLGKEAPTFSRVVLAVD